MDTAEMNKLRHIAMLAIHSSPIGPLGTQDTGGMSVYVCETARWLGRRGFAIDIFTCAKGSTAEIDLFANVRLIHLGRNRFAEISKSHLPFYVDEIFGCLEQYCRDSGRAYDWVHSHYWISALVGSMAARHWRCPHITTFHTLGAVKNDTASGENEPLGRIASERRLADLVDAMIVPAQRERDHLIEHYKADPARIQVVSCGVNLVRFKPMDRNRMRARLGLDRHADILIYVGRFAALKGIDILVGAMGHLRDIMPELQLLLVGGDGPGARSTLAIEAQVSELKIQDRVSIVGRIDPSDLPCYYSAADLLVLPSHYESFGLVVLEALACGTPVLATPVGAMESVIIPGLNGAIVASPEIGAVSHGIARFLATPRQRRPGQEEIRATVKAFGWASVAERIEAVYHKAGD